MDIIKAIAQLPQIIDIGCVSMYKLDIVPGEMKNSLDILYRSIIYPNSFLFKKESIRSDAEMEAAIIALKKNVKPYLLRIIVPVVKIEDWRIDMELNDLHKYGVVEFHFTLFDVELLFSCIHSFNNFKNVLKNA